MPINKFKRNGLSLPLVARLRKGGEMRTSKTGRQMPGKDLEHFRFDFAEERFAHLEDVITGLYGLEPDIFPGIVLTGFTTEAAFPHWMEEWGNGTLKRRCDGEKQVGGFNSGDACIAQKCKCSGVGRLSFRLPAVEDATGVIGSYMLTTTSMHDIAHLAQRLASFEKLYGTLEDVQFVLGREKRQMQSRDDSGKTMKVTKSLVYIEIDPEWASGQPQRSTTPQLELHWSQQAKRAEDFLNWAADRFKMRPDNIVAALKNIQSDVAALDDFRGSEVSAAAAIVAYDCDYMPQRIQDVSKISDAVRSEAMDIAGAIAEAGVMEESGNAGEDQYEEHFGDKGFPNR